MKRITLAVVAAMALCALILAGCGGSSGGGGTEASTTATTGGGLVGIQISEEAKACLKEKGIDLPEPKAGEGPRKFQQGEAPGPPEGGELPEGGPASGFEMNEESKKAFEECGVERPEFKGGPGAGGPNVNSAAFRKRVKEYVACVRENGFELGEPNFSGEGPIFEKAESESAAFKKASAKCQDLLRGSSG